MRAALNRVSNLYGVNPVSSARLQCYPRIVWPSFYRFCPTLPFCPTLSILPHAVHFVPRCSFLYTTFVPRCLFYPTLPCCPTLLPLSHAAVLSHAISGGCTRATITRHTPGHRKILTAESQLYFVELEPCPNNSTRNGPSPHDVQTDPQLIRKKQNSKQPHF
jgi:hypothetical protein